MVILLKYFKGHLLVPYPPTPDQIETVRRFLLSAYEQYEIRDHPGQLKHIFTISRHGERRRQVHVMRDFWDDHPTPDKIANALITCGLNVRIFEAGDRPLYVWTRGIEYGSPATE